MSARPPAKRKAAATPRIGLALGAGGARGLAHITVLEAFDDLGVKPAILSGASMGAVIGAAYAAGVPGAELRRHVLALTRNRAEMMGRLLKARVGRFTDLLAGRAGNPVLIDAEIFLDLFWPEAVPDTFEELALPFLAVATDFAARCEAIFSSGPLAPAVAGSMAIPGLIKPVSAGTRVLIDGGAANPLPYDLLFGHADIVMACDVTFGPVAEGRAAPKPFEAMFGAAQIMQGAITAAKIGARAPDILIRPGVEAFRALDFFKAAQIMRGAEGARDEVKRALHAAVEAFSKA